MLVTLASLGAARDAVASPQSGTAPGVGVWLQPGRGAQFVAAGNLAIALVRARDTGPSRLEWSGRSPAPGATSRRASAQTSGAREPGPTTSSPEPPGSATNGSPDSRSRLIDGTGFDHRQRRRLPEARAALDAPQNGRRPRAARSATPGIRLTAGEAVFHDAHAPPARSRSLVGRLS
jgi:hypothetical protein